MPNNLKKCSFHDCSSTSENPNILFHHFRKADTDKWIEACKNESLRKLTPAAIRGHKFVCEKHFSFNDYVMILSGFRSKLKPSAVPKELSEVVLLGDNLESSSQALLPKQEEENDVNRITQNGKDLNTRINQVYGRELNSACQMDEENSLSTNTASKRKKLIPGVDTRKLNFSKEVEKVGSKRTLLGRIGSPVEKISRANRKATLKAKPRKQMSRKNYAELFGEDLKPLLGPVLAEFCKMQIKSIKDRSQRYSAYHVQIALELYKGLKRDAYQFLTQFLPLPSFRTITRLLEKESCCPNKNNSMTASACSGNPVEKHKCVEEYSSSEATQSINLVEKVFQVSSQSKNCSERNYSDIDSNKSTNFDLADAKILPNSLYESSPL